MNDDVKALVAEARKYTACECHFEGVQMQNCGEHGNDEAKLIADLADALEAVQREMHARELHHFETEKLLVEAGIDPDGGRDE